MSDPAKAPRAANPNSSMGKIRILLDNNPDRSFTAPEIEVGAPAPACSVRTMLHHLTVGGKIWRPEPGRYQSLLGLTDEKKAQVVAEAKRVAGERGASMRQSRENNELAADHTAANGGGDDSAPATKTAKAKATRKGIKEKVQQAAAARAPGAEGGCPWCGKVMKIDPTEDPILERACAECEEMPFSELRTKYPEAAKAYDAEVKRQQQAKHRAAVDGNAAPLEVVATGLPAGGADLAAAQSSGEPVPNVAGAPPASESTADADAADLGSVVLFALRNGFADGASPSQLVAFVKTQPEAEGLNVTDSTVRKALEKLCKKGSAVKPEKGKYAAAPVK